VAFVAAFGERENPQIVGQACYFVDPGTNLAETAFMVHPQWQASGLGTALQRCMAAHARQRGVRGFVAEILADNEKMIRLARGGSTALGNISVENAGSTVRVTTSF
jgi:RimJ/RimL family protein N-acetyltransferase